MASSVTLAEQSALQKDCFPPPGRGQLSRVNEPIEILLPTQGNARNEIETYFYQRQQQQQHALACMYNVSLER